MYHLYTLPFVKSAFAIIAGGYLAYRLASKLNELPEEGTAAREDLSERDIDEIVDESFPASDPPSTY